jgi:predicted acylesterase/phospholipase RssA
MKTRNRLSRTSFLGVLGAGAAAGLPVRSAAAPQIRDFRADGGLVLSGGGARGAYEAGVIAALVKQAGVRDGERLPGINVVAGASIGALNGWFVATGRYSELARVWKTIASENILRPKKQFAALQDPSSGVATRLFEAVALGQGLVTNVRGVIDSGPIRDWIGRWIDPNAYFLIPLVLTVTNLTRQQREVFFHSPEAVTDVQRAMITQTVRFINGGSLIGREMSPSVAGNAILASASIPILLDPVTIPLNGVNDEYIDGGVANNAPFDITRALAKRVNVIQLDPEKLPELHAKSAIAQRKVVRSAVLDSYLETRGKRLFANVPLTDAQARYLEYLPETDLYTIQPDAELPANVPDFDKQDLIDRTYDIGYRDGLAGWKNLMADVPT